jgi:isopentenyl diphosphate isomerase/L-lactate dehydrogenase-like FMN-dependent dehydrogenase
MRKTANVARRSDNFITMVLACIAAVIVIIVLQCLIAGNCDAVLLDRVVAYIDDQAVTYSEFMIKYEKLKEAVPGISQDDALISMINSQLLLQKAKKMRLQAATDDDLIKEYVDIMIKSRVVITEDKAQDYYNGHKQEFGDKDFNAVREEIEKYLSELETNLQLKEHLKELRSQANIVIQLKGK